MEPSQSGATSSRNVVLTVLVAALGYFVDIYDLILFSIVRTKSLASLGLQGDALLDRGVLLLNMQMIGMLIGGVLWGVLGDRRGRLSVLFGSIFMYSAANIGNGLVQSVEQYAVLRFVAGIGLAGELGAGITLVSEVMTKETRGYGTTLVASVGILGAVVAALVGDSFSWRTAYFVGGGMGLALLLLRVGLFESGMFESARTREAARGDFFLLFRSAARARRYLSIIFMAVPIWYVIGILVTFSPEIAKALGTEPLPQAGRAVLFCYIGLSLGDLASGALSQVLRSRRRVIALFLGLTALGVALYFTLGGASLVGFYAICGVLGFAAGYWAVFVTMASEQFGTNIRATATTTAPNFVRGAVVLLTLSFRALVGPLGVVGAAVAVGVATLAVAVIALGSLEETYGKDLDFVE
ncbi:MAG: MFS transporter [Deltaproteobacteria bacterium]|nr:MFS transporter [Deltaproteobacteria bacterium]